MIGQRPLVARVLPADRPKPSLSASCPLPCAFCSVQRRPRLLGELPPRGLPPRPGPPSCKVKPEHNALPYLLFNVTKSSHWKQYLKVKTCFTNNITTRSWWRKVLSCPAAPRLKRTRRGQPVADPNPMNSTTLPVWLRLCPPDRVARPAKAGAPVRGGYRLAGDALRTAFPTPRYENLCIVKARRKRLFFESSENFAIFGQSTL